MRNKCTQSRDCIEHVRILENAHVSNLGGSNYGLVNRTDPNLAARCYFSTRGVRAGSDEGLDRRASSLVPCLRLPRANRLGGGAWNEAIYPARPLKRCARLERQKEKYS